MKKVISFIVLFFLAYYSYGQVIRFPKVGYANSECEILYINMTESNTTVCIDFNPVYAVFDWFSISPKTTLSFIHPTTQKICNLKIKGMSLVGLGLKENQLIPYKMGKKIDLEWHLKNTASTTAVLGFDAMPKGVKEIFISENEGVNSFRWNNILIIENSAHRFFGNYNDLVATSNDPNKGYYESIDGDYQIALFNHGDSCSLALVHYPQSEESIKARWKHGEEKATLRMTSIPNIYKADWYMVNKEKRSAVISFDSGIMSVKIDGVEKDALFIKMDKSNSNSSSNSGQPRLTEKWSGTGFALKNGYTVTNYHVVDGARNIEIYGVNGDFQNGIKATIVGSDKVNDIALLKISDENFKYKQEIPYGIKTQMSDVGESVYVLGYPLTTTMGEEIKLTDGIISSRTGFEGDVALYQISAPIQPGNSGGPLFDKDGNVIGIVCAHHKGAENVSYAIKTSYLKNLAESITTGSILPNSNRVRNFQLKDQVKQIRNFVYLIKCSK